MSIESHVEEAMKHLGKRYGGDGPDSRDILWSVIQSAIDEATATNDHAQVGALLAKCEFASVFRNGGNGWAAFTKVHGYAGSPSGYGPTQLAAIQAAVKAAEQGVGE